MTILSIAFCLCLVLLTTWMTIHLGLAHFGAGDSTAIQRSLRLLYGGVAALPLVWFALTAALVARAYLTLGEWPHGGEYRHDGSWIGAWCEANVDPAVFWPHDLLVRIVGLAVLGSMLVFPPLQLAVRGGVFRRQRGWICGYLVGLAVFVLLMLFDVGGVAEWLDG